MVEETSSSSLSVQAASTVSCNQAQTSPAATTPQAEEIKQHAAEQRPSGPPLEYDPVMRNTFPMRNTFTFSNGVRITSDFETGNLAKCQELAPELANEVEPEVTEEEEVAEQRTAAEETKSQAATNGSGSGTGAATGDENDLENKYSLTDVTTLFAPTEDELYCYNLWICPDSMPYVEGMKQKAQFYFGVTGMPPQSSIETRRTLRFRVMNDSNQARLLSYGHRPVYLVVSNQEFQAIQKGTVMVHSQKWQRIPNECSCRRGREGLCVAFEFTLGPEFGEKDHILFAYAQPFTRTDIERSIDEFEQKCNIQDGSIYFHKEVLIESLEGHPMHLLTVTGSSGVSEVQRLQGSDKDGDQIADSCDVLYKKGDGNRPLVFDKPTIFITSRVHCGETIASFFLQGMFDLLGEYGPQGRALLDNFVFKFIPLLNPDGVDRGYWRNDTQGLNLNRVYSEPDPILHPTIYATKLAILHEYVKGKLHIYTDLHGHATKRGCFVFGNTITNKKAQIQQLLLAKLLSLNCVNFDIRESNFDDSSNNKKDKKGDSRASSGRATIFRETGSGDVPCCFTLEGNYVTGLRINTLQPRFDIEKGKKILKEDHSYQDTSSNFYKKCKIPIFGSEIFRDVGQAFLVSILDMHGKNPLTRLIKKPSEEVSDALAKLKKDLKRDYQKPSIKQLKKKGSKTKRVKNMEGPTFELVLGGGNSQATSDETLSAAASQTTQEP